MREIKFRVWQDSQMLISPISSNYGLHRFFGMVYEDAVLMQFTGLQDKNGKDIYEGDILSIGDDFMVPVTFDNGGFQIVSIKEQGLSPLVRDRAVRLIVIGNIYENSELLTADNGDNK